MQRDRLSFHVKHTLVALASATSVCFACRAGRADDAPPPVQANAGLDLGVVGVGSESFWQSTKLYVGASGDLLFGRHGEGTWGYGPTVGVGTYAFHDFSAQAGGSVLVPIHEYLPIVLSAGGYERRIGGAWQPGAFGTLFWGTRSFNYQSSYALAAGLQAEARVGMGDDHERSIILSAHLDGEVLILPVLLIVNAFR